MKNKKLKEKIFDEFSNNFKEVKQELKDRNIFIKNGNNDDIYICPLCLKFFDKESLNKDSSSLLTIEHSPPKSIGGKPVCLTCKECNSIGGYAIDSRMSFTIKSIDFTNSMIKCVDIGEVGVEINNHIPAKVKFKNGEFIINVIDKGSNPYMLKIINDIKLYNKSNLKFTDNNKIDEKMYQLSMLRSAYLIFFSYMKYHCVFSKSIIKIIDQIREPESNILNDFNFILNIEDIDDDAIGLCTIEEDGDIVSYLITFKMITKTNSKNICVPIPLSDDDNLSKYKSILNGNDKNIKITKIEKEELRFIRFN